MQSRIAKPRIACAGNNSQNPQFDVTPEKSQHEKAKREKPNRDHDPLVDQGCEPRGQGRAEDHEEPCDKHRRADIEARIAAYAPKENRRQIGRGIKSETDHQIEDAGEREGAVAERDSASTPASARKTNVRRTRVRPRRTSRPRAGWSDPRTTDCADLPPAHIAARPGTARARRRASQSIRFSIARLGLSTLPSSRQRNRDGGAGNDVDEEQPVPARYVGDPAAHRGPQCGR